MFIIQGVQQRVEFLPLEKHDIHKSTIPLKYTQLFRPRKILMRNAMKNINGRYRYALLYRGHIYRATMQKRKLGYALDRSNEIAKNERH